MITHYVSVKKIKRNKKLHVSHKTRGKQFLMLFVSCQPSCGCDILSSSQAFTEHVMDNI